VIRLVLLTGVDYTADFNRCTIITKNIIVASLVKCIRKYDLGIGKLLKHFLFRPR